MATVNKIKISLRCDELSNWTAKNPVLNNGELAIVNNAGNQSFKIGNGLSTFNQLQFFNENEVKTTTLSAQDVVAKSVSQGLKAKATPLGFAAGAFLSANANFSQAFGYNAETKVDDTYAFVWNGDDARALLDYYQSHGKGTFSINPISGLQGVFIGENSLCASLSNYANVSVDNEAVQDFKLLHISYDEHAQLVNDENIDPHTIYVLSADGYDDQFGNRIINLGSPVSADDAATKNYVDSEIAKIPQPDLSEFVKLSSESAQDISSNLSIDGCLSVRNLVVQDSSVGAAKWGSIEGNVEDQTDLVKVNYPLDNPTVSSEIVNDVTYKRFDIKDHTIATISLSDETPVRIHFPDKPTENFCRDFIVKIKVTSETMPQVYFVKANNDSDIGFEYADEDWTTLEAGINYFTFTETERS